MSARIVEWVNGCESLGDAVVTIGVFDGVHVGHQTLIADTVDLARASGVRAVAVTFDRDPEQVVAPESRVPQLLEIEDKLEFIAAFGVDAIVVIPFCMRLAEMVPDRFLDDVLLQVASPIAVQVGTDFRFGRHAEGSVETLVRFGEEHGFRVTGHRLVTVAEKPVTSSRIRALIAEGDVTEAARLLGRPHRVKGTVVHGRGVGGPELEIPTANLLPRRHAALPADGVYAGFALVDEARHPACISVGIPPTFPASRDLLEAHLIDFDDDLYGREIVVEFLSRIRDQVPFPDGAKLASAIRSDIAIAREIADSRE